MNTKTTYTFTKPHLILNIQAYKNTNELRRAHPDVKSWTYIYHIPRGMSVEALRAAVAQVMKRQGQWHSMVYHVGDFIMAPALSAQAGVTTSNVKYICLERIGDNGPCPVQGH